MQALLVAIFFTFSAGFASAAEIEKPYIISGFDDVLRQAENTGLVKAALKIFEKDKSFTGMATLYSLISQQEQTPHFSLVSGITHWLHSRVDGLLTQENFPSRELFLRNWITQMDLEGFKIDKISEILQKHPGRKFIVIFDNSDASLALAEQIHQQFADRVVAIYLHQVVAKKTPPTATSYYTAFDIALAEFRANRLSVAELSQVGQSILNEQSLDLLFPNYAICPEAAQSCADTSAEAQSLCESVSSHIAKLCKARK